MPTHQGDLGLLDDPVAERLLMSRSPARLAYLWTDGTPRVIPIGFHWNGKELVLGTPPDAPKTRALVDGVKVAVSIDTDTMPYDVLQIRGSVRTWSACSSRRSGSGSWTFSSGSPVPSSAPWNERRRLADAATQ